MMKSIFALAFASLAAAKWEPEHEYSPTTSAEVAAAIKKKLYPIFDLVWNTLTDSLIKISPKSSKLI